MNYIQAICHLQPEDKVNAEITVALLAEFGFESFEESGSEVKAYIRESEFDAAEFRQFMEENSSVMGPVEIQTLKQENWNRMWESNFPMAFISGRCVIHAPFHDQVPDLEYKINIMPQMSFGTGHHETTSLMIELMLDLDIAGKDVLDMGCGTGILAIFASMKNARQVTAIDIDEWAYLNAAENCNRNGVNNVHILQGDSSLLENKSFDLILANINRNILLSNIVIYSGSLPVGGLLQLSGFYAADLPDIVAEAKKNGLEYIRHLVKKDWVAVLLIKSNHHAV